MPDAQNEIQQLDKRVSSIESAMINLTENLNKLGTALQETTRDIKSFHEENHDFLDELKTEILTTKNELGKPNWNFWGILVGLMIAIATGAYTLVQSEISHNRELMDREVMCQKHMQEVKDGHFRELLELKLNKGNVYGKN